VEAPGITLNPMLGLPSAATKRIRTMLLSAQGWRLTLHNLLRLRLRFPSVAMSSKPGC
jgi:hypothetical protein